MFNKRCVARIALNGLGMSIRKSSHMQFIGKIWLVHVISCPHCASTEYNSCAVCAKQFMSGIFWWMAVYGFAQVLMWGCSYSTMPTRRWRGSQLKQWLYAPVNTWPPQDPRVILRYRARCPCFVFMMDAALLWELWTWRYWLQIWNICVHAARTLSQDSADDDVVSTSYQGKFSVYIKVCSSRSHSWVVTRQVFS